MERVGVPSQLRSKFTISALLLIANHEGNLQLMREISKSLVDQTNKYKGAVDKLVNGGRVVGMGAGGGMSFSESLSKTASMEGPKKSGTIPVLQPSEDHLADVKVRDDDEEYESARRPALSHV